MNKYQEAPIDEGVSYQQEDQLNRSPIREAFCQTILVLLCLACYHHAVNGEFVFDDTVAIVKNTDVTTLPTNYTAIFRHDFWGVELTSIESHKSFRPLTTLMFHMEYAHMGLGARHMKAINLMLHCINTLLVWKLLCDIQFDFIDQQLVHIDQVATITAALFAIHPVHTEAVCGIVGRAELVYCMVYLLALLLTKAHEHLGGVADVLVISLTAIGLLFKETAVTIPLACVFFDYMRSEGYCVKPMKRQWRVIFSMRNIFYAVATVVLIILRLWIQNFESPRFKPVDNPVAFNVNPLTRVLSQHYLYVVNLWILICPQWLSFDWALGCIELVRNMWDLRLQAVLAVYSLVMVALINFKHNSGPILGIGLLVIPFLPACGIIKVGFVVAERILYVPSIGFCLLVGYAFVYLYTTMKQKWLLATLKWMLLLVFVCFLLRTRQRANDWLNEENLFSSALNVCPKNAKVHYNIARLATDKSDREKAFRHYHKAIELFPQYESALMNLGNLYRETGDLERAEKYIVTALEILPEFSAAWMNLGIVQSARKKFTEALISYEQALKYRKNYAICHYNMGNLFLDQKLFSEAMHHWQEAVALNPRQPKAWANILTMLDNRGLYEDAVRLSDKALKHLPNETSILFIRANVFGKLKHYVEAEALYKRVIKMEPMNMLYHTNLGVLYHRWGKLNSAVDSYERALKLNPDKAKTAHENLSKILKRKRQEELKNSNVE